MPLSISGPCDGMTCRPDLVGNPKAVPGGQNANDWINAAAFTPPYGTDQNFWENPVPNDPRWWQFGTAGARLPGLRSPGFWNVDTSLAKQFHFSESKYFELRWEMFNALNHQNLAMPDTGYCLPPNPDGSTDARSSGRLLVWSDHQYSDRPTGHGIRFEVLLVVFSPSRAGSFSPPSLCNKIAEAQRNEKARLSFGLHKHDSGRTHAQTFLRPGNFLRALARKHPGVGQAEAQPLD